MTDQITAPDFCDQDELQEYLEYLDELRESGATNMFGARAYLESDYPELTSEQAKQVLLYWMRTFSARQP